MNFNVYEFIWHFGSDTSLVCGFEQGSEKKIVKNKTMWISMSMNLYDILEVILA